jgi:hypothetical protein
MKRAAAKRARQKRRASQTRPLSTDERLGGFVVHERFTILVHLFLYRSPADPTMAVTQVELSLKM